MQEHELYMRRCLELARRGMGTTSPNPMVGALLVHNGKIIAENYHRQYGGPHAEALVVEEVRETYSGDTPRIFQESTLYVSLEPCAHYGKTPPCADLIAQQGVGRVVVACRDPFTQVDGKGIGLLVDAGVEVIEDVLFDEARWLNRRFITRIAHQRPYVILKWAETADGYMAPSDGSQRWITGAAAKQLVHRWRSEEDAVLVGANTVRSDNPQLTVREWRGRNPKRIVVARHLGIDPAASVMDGAAETIIFNESKTEWMEHVKYIALEDMDWYLPQKILFQLYLMDVQSLIVEGGRKTLDLFMSAGLWDEARVFTAAESWGEGIPSPAVHYAPASVQPVGRDQLKIYYRNPRPS